VKTVRIHPPYSILNVRGLIVIYLVLCVLTILFSKTFLIETLRNGGTPDPLNMVIFFTIPAVLLIFLALTLGSFLRDIITRRAGSRFQVRLIAYFIITVIFAAMPVTVITIQSLYELTRIWRSMNMGSILNSAQVLVSEKYARQLADLESLAATADFDSLLALPEADPAALDRRLAAVQDFQNTGEAWTEAAFAGQAEERLSAPPGLEEGFTGRNQNHLRYILYPRPGLLRLISFRMEEDFDRMNAIIEEEHSQIRIIDSLRENLPFLLVFYYGVFFLPTLLMTIIIALSFTRRVAQPIVELTEATRRVAEGDFSIHILTRRGDELGRLIRSFNSMVQDLEKSRAALIRAEKISVWQTMAQQLAHEIKNPLTPIKLSAERVLRRWRDEPERISEILENSMLAIIQEADGLSRLLNEFRTFSRPAGLSSGWTVVGELVEEAVAPYRASYPGIHFAVEHIKPDISVRMDRHRMAQVLINLVINAIDAMEGRGTLEIRTDLVKKREIDYCRLSIKDTGKGISKKDGARIFTPYFTTKASGTGLGLPIVERIVNDHGGAVWFNSAEGLGTTFFIDLPINEPRPLTGKTQNDEHTDH
jgi:nitrogen fixation/metabolism regulation signal transduction histidine kinase